MLAEESGKFVVSLDEVCIGLLRRGPGGKGGFIDTFFFAHFKQSFV